MLKGIFIGHVTRFINDIYGDNKKMQGILGEFIKRANSSQNEGMSSDFLESQGLSIAEIDRYVTYGIRPLPRVDEDDSSHSVPGGSGVGAFHSDEITVNMIRQAIHAASVLKDHLKTVMEVDKTGEYGVSSMNQQQQLQKCLADCRGLSAQDTAIYLYTTYFYSPLNKFLRGDPKITEAMQL